MGRTIRGVGLGWVLLCAITALALMVHVSFVSLAANIVAVFITITGGLAFALAWARRLQPRIMMVSATVVLSGVYLVGLWFLALGLAFYPWGEPDQVVQQDGWVCRAVYDGKYTEVRVFKAYFFGIEHLQGSYRIDGTPAQFACVQP